MKKIYLLLSVLFAAQLLSAQPGSEIYLFDLSIKKDKVIISNPVNITNHKGYDNQPSFHPEQPLLYYSSTGTDTLTDIFVYNYKTKVSKSITQTSDREFSPTITPDQTSISCIIQRKNGQQDLGKYPVEGGDASLIVDNLTIGYHVWADNSHLGLFVLGKPNSLHYLLLPMKKDTILATDIGRSLHRVPGESAFSFVQKISEKESQIRKFNSQTMKLTTVVSTLPGKDDLCWLPDGKILMSDGTKIFFVHAGKSVEWKSIDDSGTSVLKGVTRMAASPDGKKLAVVVSE
ncbi:MAG: hypothetical protein HOP08_09670 [Cyclobacteriaceae bacterium]|nr:hypothetical protein [Cyclobacteriaceae bacterium]